jgi:hypothetical protein
LASVELEEVEGLDFYLETCHRKGPTGACTFQVSICTAKSSLKNKKEKCAIFGQFFPILHPWALIMGLECNY